MKKIFIYCMLFLASFVQIIDCKAQEPTYKVTWSNEVILEFENVDFPGLISDGKKLVFVRYTQVAPVSDYGSIWTINSDGTVAKVLLSDSKTDFNSPRWSPDGSKIIFLKNHGYEMWEIKEDGTGLAPLTEKKYEKMSPIWWPDGSKIIFSKWGPEPSGLYILDFVSKSLNPFGEPDLGGPVTFSPDAKTLLVLEGQDLIFLNLDGTVKERITVKSPLKDEEPVWTLDGKYIILGNLLYVLATGEETPFLPGSVVRYPEGGKPDLVGPKSITLSRDGKKIAFVMEEPNAKTYRARIKIMNLVWK